MADPLDGQQSFTTSGITFTVPLSGLVSVPVAALVWDNTPQANNAYSFNGYVWAQLQGGMWGWKAGTLYGSVKDLSVSQPQLNQVSVTAAKLDSFQYPTGGPLGPGTQIMIQADTPFYLLDGPRKFNQVLNGGSAGKAFGPDDACNVLAPAFFAQAGGAETLQSQRWLAGQQRGLGVKYVNPCNVPKIGMAISDAHGNGPYTLAGVSQHQVDQRTLSWDSVDLDRPLDNPIADGNSWNAQALLN
jgi:hypothetical protein